MTDNNMRLDWELTAVATIAANSTEARASIGDIFHKDLFKTTAGQQIASHIINVWNMGGDPNLAEIKAMAEASGREIDFAAIESRLTSASEVRGYLATLAMMNAYPEINKRLQAAINQIGMYTLPEMTEWATTIQTIIGEILEVTEPVRQREAAEVAAERVRQLTQDEQVVELGPHLHWWPFLDPYTRGLSGMTVVAAYTGTAKSLFATNVAERMASLDNIPVLIITNEMSEDEYVDRLAAIHAAHHDIFVADFEQKELLIQAHQRLVTDDLPIRVIYKASPSVSWVTAQWERFRATFGPRSYLLIDQFTAMQPDRRLGNYVVERQEITQAIKALAGHKMLMAQINRSSQDRKDKRPVPEDLKWTSSLAEDADRCVMLYRDKDNILHREELQVAVLKHRNGPEHSSWEDEHIALLRVEFNKGLRIVHTNMVQKVYNLDAMAFGEDDEIDEDQLAFDY